MSDFRIKQGDQLPQLEDELTYDNGDPVDLSTVTSVNFVMRARGQNAPTVDAQALVTDATNGRVSYSFTSDDTAAAGIYSAYWRVLFSTGETQRFPTEGYLTVEVEENLETTNQTIVELDEVKDYLNLPSDDRGHDAELLRFVAAMTPVIEHITGPIVPRIYQNEMHDGGNVWIVVRHRPVIAVHQVVEYRGPIPYVLTQVPSPDVGTIYSYMWEPQGRIARRTVGGGQTTFPPGVDQVFVTYTAGFATIPANVRMATLELVRVNYQQTQQAGRPAFGGAGGASVDESVPAGPALGFFVPNRVRELLAPNKRYPAIA